MHEGVVFCFELVISSLCCGLSMYDHLPLGTLALSLSLLVLFNPICFVEKVSTIWFCFPVTYVP